MAKKIKIKSGITKIIQELEANNEDSIRIESGEWIILFVKKNK